MNTERRLPSINPGNIVSVIIRVMELVEAKYNDLPGQDKKSQVLGIVYDLINGSNFPPDKKEFMTDIVNSIFDSLVEGIIDTGRGKFNINKTAIGCFSKIISIFKKCIYHNTTI